LTLFDIDGSGKIGRDYRRGTIARKLKPHRRASPPPSQKPGRDSRDLS
jgi:hypothetical protein